jgi:Zn-dependent protease/CBS domain-containing protein
MPVGFRAAFEHNVLRRERDRGCERDDGADSEGNRSFARDEENVGRRGEDRMKETHMRIGRLFGIDVVVDVSWLFIFALVAWSLGSSAGPFAAAAVTPTERALLASGTALLFFASVLVHELAHSLVARSNGIPISEIRLFVFGGVSRFAGEPKTAPGAAWIAAVGPATSFAIAMIAAGLARLAGPAAPVGAALAYLAAANAILGAFNLLPAFPLDGGRVLHAIVWRVTGDRLRATRIATRIGAGLAWVLIVAGIVQTLAFGFGGGLWYTFVGWFLLQSGQGEARAAELTVALQGHSALQLASPAAATLPADALAGSALKTMLARGARALPVLVGDRFAGLVTLREFAHADASTLESTYVTALMKRVPEVRTLAPETNATEALRLLAETGFHQLPVVDGDDRFLGFVTREGLIEWLAHDREPHVAAALR